VVQRAVALGERCRDLERSAREAASRLCARCEPGERQAALDEYRNQLAALQRAARRSAALITSLRSDRAERDTAAAYRRDGDAITRGVVEGLVAYEQRLHAVRRAFGWTAESRPATSPAAPARRP
jgi:hypothetical protein